MSGCLVGAEMLRCSGVLSCSSVGFKNLIYCLRPFEIVNKIWRKKKKKKKKKQNNEAVVDLKEPLKAAVGTQYYLQVTKPER